MTLAGSADPIDVEVGRRVRLLREQLHERQDDIAARARRYGLDWSRDIVWRVETGQRSLSVGEGLRLAQALDVDLDKLTEPARELLNRERGEGFDEMPARPSDAEFKAARKLGVTPRDVVSAAHSLWGRSLADERDRRVAEHAEHGSTSRTLQARRGHVTRALTTELATHIDKMKGKKPCEEASSSGGPATQLSTGRRTPPPGEPSKSGAAVSRRRGKRSGS